MSPEMLEAQRRLAKKQREKGLSGNRVGSAARVRNMGTASANRVARVQSGRTAEGVAFQRTEVEMSYSASGGGDSLRRMQRVTQRNDGGLRTHGVAQKNNSGLHAQRMAQRNSSGNLRAQGMRASVASGPMTAPRRPRAVSKQPTGPVGADGLETLDFEALEELDELSRTEELAGAFIEEPEPLVTEGRGRRNGSRREMRDGARNGIEDGSRSSSGAMMGAARADVRAKKLNNGENSGANTMVGGKNGSTNFMVGRKNGGRNSGNGSRGTSVHGGANGINGTNGANGASPFINTLNIEKRPLSGHSVNTKKVRAEKVPSPKPYLTASDGVPTVVHDKRKNRRSSFALVVAIILTVILGAVVGAVIYLACFQ